MDDPWDVGSRTSNQYISCMKINGVPVLPPLLSRECRKEMQYYKVLALEVEKRITSLKTIVSSSNSSNAVTEIETDIATETDVVTDCENIEETHEVAEEIHAVSHDFLDINLINANTLATSPSDISITTKSDTSSPNAEENERPNTTDNVGLRSPRLVIGIIGDIFKDKLDKEAISIPEREIKCHTDKNIIKEVDNKENIHPENGVLESLITPKTMSEKRNIQRTTGPSSLGSSRSFDDIHAELTSPPRLVRQRSYTILKPGPALQAHLERQSLKSGVEVSSISMSESCCNLTRWSRKRKSWDLETAKSKWSSMASELNDKGITRQTYIAPPRVQINQYSTRGKSTTEKRKSNTSVTRANSNAIYNGEQKSTQRPTVKANSPFCKESKIDNGNLINSPSTQTPKKDIPNRNLPEKNSTINRTMTITSENSAPASEDPSSCIRDLYEKIRSQQLVKMASLIEKQKREKQMLQQAFEEQNSLFYKQLRTICPKSPIEVKEAWTEKRESPVSLSQLINGTKTNNCPVMEYLNDSQNFLQKSDEILKRSRDIRLNSATKKLQHKSPCAEPVNQRSVGIIPQRGSQQNSDPRRIVTSDGSTSREMEPILTDRTDNTMADLNITLASDENDVIRDYQNDPMTHGYSFVTGNENPVSARTIFERSSPIASSTENGYTVTDHSRSRVERKSVRRLFSDKPPSMEERLAASRIVAHARGYLTRRLLRTERVKTTVQTIRDALVCALDLHRDRDGIRGADIDLHRRLIQQITAACYSLHDIFVASTPQQRCALIAQDRERQRLLEVKRVSSSFSRSSVPPSRRSGSRSRKSGVGDRMTKSHSGAVASPPRVSSRAMTRSSHEMYSCEKEQHVSPKKYITESKELHSRRPWR